MSENASSDSEQELLTAEETLDILERTCLIHATVHDDPQDCSVATESEQ